MLTPLKRLNSNRPPFIDLLNGRVIASDSEEQSCTFEFGPPKITATPSMLCKVASSRSCSMLPCRTPVFAHLGPEGVNALSSLEVTTRYHAVTRGGKGPVYAKGWIRQATYKTAFMESELVDQDGKLLATAQSVAKIARQSS
jgi:acyl-coenzyme A thioesterase PaaI-like protein